MNPYEILGLPPTCQDDEIKTAYRNLARQFHPDRGGDPQKFREIQSAYDLIGTVVKRAVYDLERRRSGVTDARREARQIVREYLDSLERRRPQ